MAERHPPITLADIRAAADRIRGRVRRTPTWQVPRMTVAGLPHDLYLKLEFLQVTGSFKPRGAFNKVLGLEVAPRGLVTSSGGNHGIAVAHVGHELGLPVSIPLPANVAPEKLAAMRALGAEAGIVAPTFVESNARARQIAAERGYLYIHPFADPAGIAGQGTVGLEILEDHPDVDLVVVAVGGGGLLGGVAAAIKEQRPRAVIVGVEPVGADALTRSLEAGRLVTLPKIETRAATLAPTMTEQIDLELAQRYVDHMVRVTDEQIVAAARWLWHGFFIGAELGGAASTAALLAGLVPVTAGTKVVSIVCGGGGAGMAGG
ncbi:MAG: pyridoxal-phosphate dependent enzyme [Steroidobacteraceae bacterium]|jgi:threonine dehydratase